MNGLPRRLVVALGGFAAAALVFGYALFRALTIEPASAAPLPPPATLSPSSSAAARADATKAAPSVPAPVEKPALDARTTKAAAPKSAKEINLEALMLAVDADPFRENRERVRERYRMPGEEVQVEPEAPPPPPPPPLRVVGTVVTATSAAAIVQTDNGQSRVVGVGEMISGYRIDRIAANNATVSGMGQTVTLPVQVATRGRTTSTTRPGTTTNPAQDARAREAQAMQMQSMQRALEQLRSMGNTPEIQQAMQQVMRQMEGLMRQGAGGAAGGVMEIRTAVPREAPVPARPPVRDTIRGTRNQ